MNFDSIWLIIVAISAPITGVVAFYIQLRNLKKINLENERLQLEIEYLKKENSKSENQIEIPTTEEVKKYGRFGINFALKESPDRSEEKSLFSKFKSIDWGSLLLAISITGFIAYFFYDIYRFGKWIWSLLL